MADLEDLNPDLAPLAGEADHAVFTSLPSATGEGYRLVAWSPGVKAEERAELTRRGPSHGSLCGGAGASRALAVLCLESSGRTAWAFSRVAGAEHTRRGGGRVWTDFLLPSPGDEALGFLPARAFAAAVPGPSGRPQPSLPRLRVASQAPVPMAAEPRSRLCAYVASLLEGGRQAVVATGGDPVAVLDVAIAMLPAARRRGLEACAGLRFSRARGVRLTLVDAIDPETTRATRGQGVDCIDAARDCPEPAGEDAAWWRLQSRWWREGRGGEALALADAMRADATCARLARAAAEAEAVDAAPGATSAFGAVHAAIALARA